MPLLIRDEPDVVVIDPRTDLTCIYDLTLRQPAAPIAERWPLLGGFEVGARVGVIAISLARGERWTVGPATEASGPAVIWLSPLDVPYDQQMAAWWVGFDDQCCG